MLYRSVSRRRVGAANSTSELCWAAAPGTGEEHWILCSLVNKMDVAAKCVIALMVLLLRLAEGMRAPDKAPVIDREAGWCDNGQVTRTTGECICSSHRGFFCRDQMGDVRSTSGGKGTCEAGYGISFFHFTCKTCSCINRVKIDELPKAADWRERKQALRMASRKEQPSKSRQQVPIV